MKEIASVHSSYKFDYCMRGLMKYGSLVLTIILTFRRENGNIHNLYAVCCSNMKKVFCLREVHMDLEQ